MGRKRENRAKEGGRKNNCPYAGFIRLQSLNDTVWGTQQGGVP